MNPPAGLNAGATLNALEGIRPPETPARGQLPQKIAFAMIMGVVTTGVISFTLISLNLGFGERFLRTWLKSWAIGYAVVIPAILLLGPIVQLLVERLFDRTSAPSVSATKSPS